MVGVLFYGANCGENRRNRRRLRRILLSVSHESTVLPLSGNLMNELCQLLRLYQR